MVRHAVNWTEVKIIPVYSTEIMGTANIITMVDRNKMVYNWYLNAYYIIVDTLLWTKSYFKLSKNITVNIDVCYCRFYSEISQKS